MFYENKETEYNNNALNFNSMDSFQQNKNLISQEKNIFIPSLIISHDFIDRYICGLCKNICDEPRFQYCSCPTPFCKRCLDLYYDSNQNKCPKCKKVTRELIPGEAFNESILDLKIKCRNSSCPWTGKLRDYKEHIKEKCPKEFINCPNKGCIFKSRREEMKNHIEKCNNMEYICNKCQSKAKMIDKSSHINVCPKELVKCSKGCDQYVERGFILQHEMKCPNSYIDCPYYFIGCKDKLIKNEIEKRLIEDTSKHLSLAIELIQNLSEEIKDLKTEVNILKNDNNDLKKVIDEIKEVIKKNYFLEIKQNNILDKETNINDENGFSKSCQLLSKKRQLSIDNIENNLFDKSNKNFFLLNVNKENDDKDTDKKNKIEDNPKNFDSNFIFSPSEKTKELFTIKDNIIGTECLTGEKHYFVFFNKKYDIPKTSTIKYSFQIKLLQRTEFLGIGICDKKMVERNNYEFEAKKFTKKSNGGLYAIYTNQVVWNCNNSSQCIKLNYKKMNKKDTFIDCTLSPCECELEFMVNNEFFFVLNNVRCFLSDYFSPCLVFLKNTSIEVHFNY